MRISAINNFKGNFYTNLRQSNKDFSNKSNSGMSSSYVSNSSMLVDKNYGSLLAKKNNVSFAGVAPDKALSIAKQIPLADRIATMFDFFEHGDLILVSKNLQEGQKALKSAYKSAGQLFKKNLFIPDDNISEPLAFVKHQQGDKEIWNISNKNIYINNKDFLKPKESCYFLDGDKIKIGDFEMTMKEKAKTDLNAFKKIFAKSIDLNQQIAPVINKQNLKSILSIAQEVKKGTEPIRFKDVGGQDKAIDMLKKQILYPIKYPEAFKDTMLSHGALMYGPPGTGKTRLAAALANEADINFIKMNGLEMESKWVGESEENWRKLFEAAKEEQPSIIFLDEFDAVAKERGGQDVYGDKVVNQLLTLMSDLEKDGDDVYVIAATNKKDNIDKAILRSGRFGVHIPVELPDEKGVRQILDIHLKGKDIDADIDKLSKKLFERKASGSDIAAVVTSAKTNSYDRNGIYQKMENGTFSPKDLEGVKINQQDFIKAVENVFSMTKKRNPIGFNNI